MKLYELVNKYHIGTDLSCAEAMFKACNEYYQLNLSEETRKMFSVMGIGMQSELSCCGAFTVAAGMIGLFTAEEGNGIYRIYSLEKMGKYLLNSRGIECKWQPTDNTKPVAMIKKRLAGNQVIISYLRKVQAFDSYTVKPTFTAKQSGKIFKMHAGIRITKSGKSANLVFEAVRREENWEKKLADRMRLVKDFYENFVQFDSGYETKPQFILLCEDDKHTVETFKVIVSNKLEIANAKIYFTTDLKQNSKNLATSLTEFVLDEETGKYKIQELNLKILG